jgi:hypothetical protein
MVWSTYARHWPWLSEENQTLALRQLPVGARRRQAATM